MGPGLPGESQGQVLRRHGERTEVVREKGFVDKELPMSTRSRKLASAPVLGPPHHTIYNPPPPPQAHEAPVSLEC